MLQTTNKQSTNMKLKMIPCSNCGAMMPELRLLKYGYSYCIKCSEAGLGAVRRVRHGCGGYLRAVGQLGDGRVDRGGSGLEPDRLPLEREPEARGGGRSRDGRRRRGGRAVGRGD